MENKDFNPWKGTSVTIWDGQTISIARKPENPVDQVTEPLDEQTLEMIREHFNIAPEKIKPLVHEIIYSRKNWKPETLDSTFLEQKQAENEVFQVRQIIQTINQDIKSGKRPNLDFLMITDAGNPGQNRIKITTPQNVKKIVSALLDNPGQQFKTRQGNLNRKWKNAFYKYWVYECLTFLNDNTTMEFSKTDQCYFTGLIFALAGLEKTCNQMNEPKEICRRKMFDSFKRFI
jgi:hypothetical protein